MTAYHFYRLIYRAKKIYLIYDTRSEGLKSGEKSRFIHQLKYHYQLPLKENITTYNISSNKREEVIIEKNPALVKRIGELFYIGGERMLSASSINTYLDCPLKFYFQYVKGIEEEETVSEGVEADTFGSIFHKAMEILYEDFKGKVVTRESLSILMKNNKKIEDSITDAFYHVLKMKEIKGHNLLIHKLITRYILQTARYDISKTPFEYVSSEQRKCFNFTLENGTIVPLKGYIDRIDIKEGTKRIVDYKTGSGDLKFRSVQDLFDTTARQRNKIAMQMIMYALMLYDNKPVIIAPYLLRELFKEDSGLEMIVDKELLDEFSGSLSTILGKIFDSTSPFIQTDDLIRCSYCPFSVICR